MSWNLATAKARLAITDDSRDAQIQAAMNASLAIAERYCGRRFMFKADNEVIFRPAGQALHVYRWPIKEVKSVQSLSPRDWSPLQTLSTWWADFEQGVIHLQQCGTLPGVKVVFDGGFDPLPEDLEFALWLVFDQVWATTPGWGLPAGSGGTSGGPVRSFQIDGTQITYDTSAEVGSAGPAGGGASGWGVIPALAAATLDWYRAETVIGGA